MKKRFISPAWTPTPRPKNTPEAIFHTLASQMPVALANKVKRIANKHHSGSVSEYFRAFARADQRQGSDEVEK